MAVIRITRWSGGTRDQVIAAIKAARTFATQFNVEIQASQIIAGSNKDQWFTWQRFPDRASYDRAEAFYGADDKYTETMTPLLTPFKIEERYVIDTIDI